MTGTDVVTTPGVHAGTLAPALITDAEIDRTYRLAKALAMSQFFKDAKQAEQAFAKILLGRDLGLSPTQAMIGIHIVEGKPEMSANLQAQRVREYRGADGQRYDYRVVEHTDEVCTLRFLRKELDGEWEELGTETFKWADAVKAGLANKDNYKKYPRNMLFARCLSNGVAFHCPEVMGGHRVYHEGEIEVPQLVAPAPPPAPAPAPAPTDPAPAGPAADSTDGEADEMLGDTERAQLVEAFAAAGVDDITTFLTAVGVESTDDLSVADGLKLRELLGEHLQRVAA